MQRRTVLTIIPSLLVAEIVNGQETKKVEANKFAGQAHPRGTVGRRIELSDPFALYDFRNLGAYSQIYEYTLPANKQMRIRIRISAGKENGVRVQVDNGGLMWFRNTAEVHPPNATDYTFYPVNRDRSFVFDSVSKDCNLNSNPNGCPSRPWYLNYGPNIINEEDDYIDMTWDDSNNPPQHANDELEIFISG